MLYFFNVAGAIFDPDEKGVELTTIGEARHMAVLYASELMRDNATDGWAGEEFRVEVTDAYQMQRFTIVMFGDDTPAIGKSPFDS